MTPTAATRPASAVDAAVPFIAWVAPHNTPSVKVAERLALTNHGLHADPSDGELRLAYADRPLDSGDWYADSARRQAPETR
jgi:hypothetical protein